MFDIVKYKSYKICLNINSFINFFFLENINFVIITFGQMSHIDMILYSGYIETLTGRIPRTKQSDIDFLPLIQCSFQ